MKITANEAKAHFKREERLLSKHLKIMHLVLRKKNHSLKKQNKIIKMHIILNKRNQKKKKQARPIQKSRNDDEKLLLNHLKVIQFNLAN